MTLTSVGLGNGEDNQYPAVGEVARGACVEDAAVTFLEDFDGLLRQRMAAAPLHDLARKDAPTLEARQR